MAPGPQTTTSSEELSQEPRTLSPSTPAPEWRLAQQHSEIEVRANSIHSNGGKGILSSGPRPTITSAGSAAGTACANCIVDVFSDNADEGRVYHGSALANASGNWSFPGAVVGPN